ncbi:carboxypeptidase-like regulatory domain-containing protein [Spongiivirga sp. MCCC 1A20706]|uniref:carboxypeptidase-like regulatory domain-containing protein n=1 Tax=Spongiivirga sp. MCCC 1A20706 TaxID=3160963 RepID=UPI0039779CE6
MRHFLLLLSCVLISVSTFAQNGNVEAQIINAEDDSALQNVHVLNLNRVIGTITDSKGNFTIPAAVNDTLFFSYLGFKSIKIRVTNDLLKIPGTKIQLTELAYTLEEVILQPFELTGYLEIDNKYVPVERNYRYSISGLPTGYEAGSYSPGAITRVLGAIFNPADFLHNIFGKKPKQLRKLRKMQEEDEIRNLLTTKFDREVLLEILELDRTDLDELLQHCNYSKSFIKTANDLQILDALSECYEEFKVLNRN